MSSALNHKKRSRKTYRNRIAAARYFCSNNFTREQRAAMRLQMQMRWGNFFTKPTAESDVNE